MPRSMLCVYSLNVSGNRPHAWNLLEFEVFWPFPCFTFWKETLVDQLLTDRCHEMKIWMKFAFCLWMQKFSANHKRLLFGIHFLNVSWIHANQFGHAFCRPSLDVTFESCLQGAYEQLLFCNSGCSAWMGFLGFQHTVFILSWEFEL